MQFCRMDVEVRNLKKKMGCGVSNGGVKSTTLPTPEDADLKLSSCRLHFSPQQLLRLNQRFTTFLEGNNHAGSEKSRDNQVQYLAVVVERLIQRLICNVGNLDSRFSSKFLINLDPQKNYVYEPRKRLKFKYLVRLDLVSTPALYPQVFEPPVRIIEGTDNKSLPQGYAKIKVHGEFLEEWAGFISPHGFLRRDKVQERFVELLARAAARPTEPLSPAQVDESKFCGSPGKVVDPITLHYILNTVPSHQVFFGSAECNETRFPDPRDFRIAIVEGTPDTRLHISFLSPTAQSISAADDVEISITLGIGVAGWPVGSDFPSRLPLDHVDVILGYRAAQLDYYLVPRGPHSSLYYEDKSSIWEIRTLATEMFLDYHYSPTSVVSRVYKTLVYLLEILKARGVKTINRYILKNLLLFELEHKSKIQQWAPKAISRRVLSILDRLLIFLRNQMIPSYIFTGKNLLLQDDALEEDYISDSDILENYLKQLHNDGFKLENESNEYSGKDELENVMLQKWDNVIGNMLPPMSNRSRRLGVVNNSPVNVSYTRQQMEYVALLVREVLKVKKIQRRNSLRDMTKIADESKEELTNREDFIYLLQIMFDQAKQKLFTCGSRKIGGRKTFKLDQVVLSYDISTAMLIDDIRRTREMDFNFSDDMSIVVKMMECLYKAIDSDGRVLGPVLRPYLSQIFKGSHENCCFLSEWKRRTDLSEFQAIGAFCRLVLSGKITPEDGIINSAGKGWNWATNCLKIMQTITEENLKRIIIGEKIDLNETGLRLIFTPSPGKTLRVNVSNAKGRRSPGEETSGADSRYATIRSFQDVLDSVISPTETEQEHECKKERTKKRLRGEKQPPHLQLRDGNPFTLASMEIRRQGNHRGLGSIVQALISLQKLTTLQEISQYLPESERTRVLSDIKKLSKEVQRMAVENYRSKKSSFSGRRNRFIFKRATKTLPTLSLIRQRKITEIFPRVLKNNSEPQESGVYRSLNEFSVPAKEDEIQRDLKNREKQLDEELKKAKEESLLGTCRKLRRECRGTVLGPNPSSTVPKAGRFRKGSSTFPKSVINTPFYIKVSSYDSRQGGEATVVTKTSKL